MNRKSSLLLRIGFMNVARASLFVMLVSLFFITPIFRASAADLQNRSVAVGTPEPSATTNHVFQFRNPTANVLGSIRLQYCGNSPLFNVACVAPAGLNVSSATLLSQVGNVGFAKDGLTDTSNFVISRAPAGALSGTLSTYTLSNVINPSTADVTVYVRIELFASADTSGPAFDQGAIAFSTNGKFSVGAFVPPFLAFCVGVTVASDCSSTSGSLVNFGELSPNSTSSTTTQFAGATNDPTGMQIFLNGQTMTSGNNVINALNSAASSSVGSSQFGINLRQNSQPSVGANRTGLGSTNPDTGYGTSNQYKFNSGDRIARSTLPTEYNVFTVSYIANVPEDQPPGVYATTLLYTALVSF